MKFKKIFSSETIESISTKLCWNDPWVVPHQNFVVIEQMVSDKKIFMGISHRVLCWINFGCGVHLGRISEMLDTFLEEHIKIFSSETTGPIATKLWWNDPWMAPFQKCVRWSQLPTKMATKLKIEKRGMKFEKNLLLWNYWVDLNQTLLKWSLGGPLPKLDFYVNFP
jgi:hypothetical protein